MEEADSRLSAPFQHFIYLKVQLRLSQSAKSVSNHLKTYIFERLPTVHCRPRGLRSSESRETDRSIGRNDRRLHSSRGDCAVSRPAKRSQGHHDPSRGPWPTAADSRAGASDAVVGQRPSVGDVDWPRGAVSAALPLGTVGCSRIARDRNGRRRRKRRHSHDSYGFRAQLRT
jgi:hypothetical protein